MFTVSLFFPVRIRRNNPRSKKTLELIEGAMAGVNERLIREATSYPARVEGEDLFCLFSSSHFSRLRSWSTLLYTHLLYPPYFLLLYIY